MGDRPSIPELIARVTARQDVLFVLDDDEDRVLFGHWCADSAGNRYASVAWLPNSVWTVAQRSPLTVVPSIWCQATAGGCGLHGWIRDGQWVLV